MCLYERERDTYIHRWIDIHIDKETDLPDRQTDRYRHKLLVMDGGEGHITSWDNDMS